MKEDRRIQKTKQALINAFGALVKQHESYHMTVKELCEKADINRSTFYLYYQDLNDFLDQLQDSVVKEVAQIINTYHHPKIPMLQNRELILALFVYFEEKQYFMQAILTRSALRRAIIEHFCFILESEQIFEDYENKDLMIPYITYGLIGLVNKWLNTKKESPEEMTEITLDFFNGQFHRKEKG